MLKDKAKPLGAAPERRKASAAMFGESGHRRVAYDAYLTLDAGWIIPALLSKVRLRGPVFEPAAGKGHLIDALVEAGFKVRGSDLIDHGHGRPDISVGVDLFALEAEDLADVGSIVTNLPYDVLDDATAYILALAEPAGLQVCSLVRSEWSNAKARRQLVHNHAALDTIVHLTKRPRWAADSTASPRHYFSWIVWDFQRDVTLPPAVRFAP